MARGLGDEMQAGVAVPDLPAGDSPALVGHGADSLL